jgi:hypothetical protein
MRKTPAPYLLLFLLALAGCSGKEVLENEMLKGRIRELERKNADLQVQLSQAEEKIKRLDREGENLRDIRATAETLRWRSPTDVATTSRERAVRANMETIQVIAESYAREHEGYYPGMETLLNRIPGGLVNPFTESSNLRDVVVAGIPGKPGVAGYDVSLDEAGRGVSYRLYGHGAEGLLKTVLRGSRG